MTYQQQLENDRQSERTRLEKQMRPNTVQASAKNGRGGIAIRDHAGRISLVKFDSAAQVDELIADLQRVRNSIVASTETAPETLRSLPL